MKYGRLLLLAVLSMAGLQAGAFSFALDSIAAMGKVPAQAVRMYHQASTFFNGYDTTYVTPTGYRFTAKLTGEAWTQSYNFYFPESKTASLMNTPTISVGAHVNYMAVSLGYDVNVNKLFKGIDRSRQRLRLGFECMLFAVEAYWIRNHSGTTLRKFGPSDHPDHPDTHFPGVANSTWGLDAYYFFDHKHYAQAAAFSYSRIQRRSHGSFFTGLSFYREELNFNFGGLPEHYIEMLPPEWAPNYHYRVDTRNYAVRIGYGYNWVFARGWLLGVSESPVVGVSYGHVTPWVNGSRRKVSMSLYNRLKFGLVWNHHRRWFCAMSGRFDVSIISKKSTTYAGGDLDTEVMVGYRF